MADETQGMETPTKEDVKLFTVEEVNKIVSKRVNEAHASDKLEMQDTLDKARAEWEETHRIESLKGEEKLKAEHQRQMSKVEAERKALEEQYANATRELAITKAQAQLAALNLPVEFASNLLGSDDAQTTSNIQAFNAKVNELVTAKVNESLARGTPSVGGTTPGQSTNRFADIDRAMGF